jgi:hypothetical protein
VALALRAEVMFLPSYNRPIEKGSINMNAFFRSLVDVLPSFTSRSRKARYPGRYLPRLERLEDRLVLAPAAPALVSISDATVTEGDFGQRIAVFTVSLSGHNRTTTVDYATADGTATLADHDYRLTDGTLTFRPGQNTKTIRIPVVGDHRLEADETFVVNVTGARGGNRSGVTIRDSQRLGTIRNDERGIFVDDFADGNNDGWTHIDFTGIATFDASSAAYRLRTADALPPDDASFGTMAATWEGSRDNPAFGHGIVRGSLRANTEGTTAGYLLRANTNPNEDHDYGFFGSTSFGTFYIERFDIQAGGQTIIAMADPAEHPFEVGEDYRIEAGVWGDRIWMRAWKVGEPRPVLPLLTVRDDTFGPEDGTLLNVIAFFDPAAVTGAVQVDATFDDITFTRLPGRHGNHLHWLNIFVDDWSRLPDSRSIGESECTLPRNQAAQHRAHHLGTLLRAYDHILGRQREDDVMFENAQALAMQRVSGGGGDSHTIVDQVFADDKFGGLRVQIRS